MLTQIKSYALKYLIGDKYEYAEENTKYFSYHTVTHTDKEREREKRSCVCWLT